MPVHYLIVEVVIKLWAPCLSVDWEQISLNSFYDTYIVHGRKSEGMEGRILIIHILLKQPHLYLGLFCDPPGAQSIEISCHKKSTQTEGSHLQVGTVSWPAWIPRAAFYPERSQIQFWDLHIETGNNFLGFSMLLHVLEWPDIIWSKSVSIVLSLTATVSFMYRRYHTSCLWHPLTHYHWPDLREFGNFPKNCMTTRKT